MDFTKSKGSLTELKCMMKFIEWGFDVSIPYGDASKYDFIADINGKLLRFQCKTSSHPKRDGVVDENAFVFDTTCQTTNTKKTTRYQYTDEQIDYFATSFNDNVYIVPVNECSTAKTLRLQPPRNGNKTYNKAEDYLMEKIFADEIDKDYKQQNNINTGVDPDKEKQPKNFCSICGAPISKKATMCVKCSHEAQQIVERPNREELKNMIRTIPFTQLANKFGVSDNAIRKWCKAMDLPFKKTVIQSMSEEEWQKI